MHPPTLLTVTTAGTRLRLTPAPAHLSAHPKKCSTSAERGPLPLSVSTLARVEDFMLKHQAKHLFDGTRLLSLVDGQLVPCGTMSQ